MFTLIIGGSASGKSAYAEEFVLSLYGRRIYLATMRCEDKESGRRIARHRRARSGKGFETYECSEKLEQLQLPPDGNVLLEDLGNLLANEMFSPGGGGAEGALRGIRRVRDISLHLTVVANEIFSGGDDFGESTLAYIREMGILTRILASEADAVCEVVCGCPNYLKVPDPAADTRHKEVIAAAGSIRLHESAAHRNNAHFRKEPTDRNRRMRQAEEHADRGGSGGKHMTLITGPMYGGKREFACRLLGCEMDELKEHAVWDVEKKAAEIPDLSACAEELSRHEIVIVTESGCGVVPADPKARARREAAGRLACLLAERADVVIRISCGLPQVLKNVTMGTVPGVTVPGVTFSRPGRLEEERA